GEFAIEPKFDGVGNFSEGLVAVKLNEKWGFIDKNGDFVIKPKFDDIGY
ncbi:TPA: WG repeat-containing protein, partial [Campylobacter coli]|nr:WG repeat-containing protein [Campylobacter coli]